MIFGFPANRTVVTTINNKTLIPVTYAQAFECLYIELNNRVHSILTSGFIYGTELDLPKVHEILRTAESSGKLFISDKFGGEYRHDIAAWDQKYQKWVHLECIPEEVEALKKVLALKVS